MHIGNIVFLLPSVRPRLLRRIYTKSLINFISFLLVIGVL